ncbi:polyprenyl synthetase family protein [Streptomyces spectabilis]|uniref:Geranylgeranyl diphosphate synthase type I n=1 Tax=Streptomyces spectabilis TaxID=68270 RepID=A0A7W8F037_STRST|nr:polyprenyl synthetase family protein [Streptomyces spectabilis]MBB5109799.1 geranylgeranyl diphosphate synthase type I [Streptomyces spectabilis]GGV55629.1 geranylgeranyl pyrophosphate synthase [Streptomyces spectabilis]
MSASNTQTLPPYTEPRQRIDDVLAAFLGRMASHFAEPPALARVFELLRGFVLHGGKRIRPLLCYWGWRGAGGNTGEHAVITAAASLEVFHAYALIHDDIMDASDTRRRHPTLHRSLAELHRRSRWREAPGHAGVALAMLAGDLCLMWSDALIDSGGVPADRLRQAREVLHRMRLEILTGQYLDLLGQAAGASLADALDIIQYKTGKYTVELPLRLAAVLAGAPPALLPAYSGFGIPLGEAFQLRDDILAVFRDPAITGKSDMEDLREGEPTVLAALARRRAIPAQTTRFNALYDDADLDEDGATELRDIMTATGALAVVEDMISQRTASALHALHAAPITAEARAHLAAMGPCRHHPYLLTQRDHREPS